MSLLDVAAPLVGEPAESVLVPPGACPQPVQRPLMTQEWRNLTFIHLPVSPWRVQRLLPDGLTVDCSQGVAWVGIVPHHLRVTAGRRPGIPLGAFPELDVRTYVSGPAGPGLAFLTIDSPRFTAVATARAMYRMNYRWSAVSIASDGPIVRYSTRRRGTHADIEVRIDGPLRRVTDLEQFFTARWRVYGWRGSALWTATVAHEPWPLEHAELLHFRQNLLPQLGLVPLNPEAHVMHSPGVRALMSRPSRVITDVLDKTAMS